MQSFISNFEHLPLWIKAGWIVFFITIFWILEGSFSFYKKPYNKWKHAKINFALLLIVVVINTLFGIALAGIDTWLSKSNFGLLNLFSAPLWVKLLLAIVVLDFTSQYLVHYLLHKVRWMWRLHITHHTDKHVDVTTGTRHHPLDFFIRESMALLVVILMGMPVAFYLLYRMITIPFTYFNHADITLPAKVDKFLSYIIVTPTMHKFHHHHKLPWTDSNYGNVLSIWDHIFGTYVYENASEIQFGLDSADHVDDNDLVKQLKIPFDRSVKSLD